MKKYKKINNFFLELKKNKISDAEFREINTNSFFFSVFDDKILNYNANNTNNCNIGAIIDEKMSIMNFEKPLNNKKIKNIIDLLIKNSKYINKKDALIYKKKSKYDNFQYFNKNFKNVNNNDKKKIIFEINEKIKKFSNLIKKIEISYEEIEEEKIYSNTSKINLRQKTNIFSIGAYIVVSDGNKTKTETLSFNDNDIKKFNIDNFVNKLCSSALKKLNTNSSITNGVYDVIFSPKITKLLTYYYSTQLNAEKVLKKTSWFSNKINTKVANEKISIDDKPLEKNLNFTSFDDQGVPTKNISLIKNGILKTYIHNLNTAKKFSTSSTGHAFLLNGQITTKIYNIYLKPGKISENEIIKKIKCGIYITDLEGLHVGMNLENGDFSLKAEGYKIENGKIENFVDMITINYNLYDIFKNIDLISENIEYMHNAFSPCILLKNKCSISCDV